MKEERDLVALGMAVHYSKSTVHEVLGGRDHVVTKHLIEGGLEVVEFLRQARESAPIDPRDHEHLGKHAAVDHRSTSADI